MGRRKRGWSAASGLGLADLQRLIEAKHSELAARRSAIAAELEAIDAELGGGNGAVRRRAPGRPAKSGRGPGRPPRVGRSKGRRGRPPKGAGRSELHDRIRTAMKGASAPMKATDIAKKVLAGGYETKSKVFHLIVGQRLAEMRDVRKPERGVYELN